MGADFYGCSGEGVDNYSVLNVTFGGDFDGVDVAVGVGFVCSDNAIWAYVDAGADVDVSDDLC